MAMKEIIMDKHTKDLAEYYELEINEEPGCTIIDSNGNEISRRCCVNIWHRAYSCRIEKGSGGMSWEPMDDNGSSKLGNILAIVFFTSLIGLLVVAYYMGW